MAEYQAMVYCKSTILNSPSDISSIVNMSGKNLRVGNFTIAATGFDKYNVLYWYIAVNIPQQSIILVHRGTRSSNRVCFIRNISFKAHVLMIVERCLRRSQSRENT